MSEEPEKITIPEEEDPSADLEIIFSTSSKRGLLELLARYSLLLDQSTIRGNRAYKQRELAYTIWKDKEARGWVDGKIKGNNEQDRRSKLFLYCESEIKSHRDWSIKENACKAMAYRLKERVGLVKLLLTLDLEEGEDHVQGEVLLPTKEENASKNEQSN